jgi:cellulose synthase (UDP-forming)
MSHATGLTFWDALVPGLIVILASAAILPWLDRKRELWRTLVVIVCLAVMWRYLSWRIYQTLPPAELSADFALGLLFLSVEFLSATGATISLIVLTRTRSRTQEADRDAEWLNGLPHRPLVDVLICTYNEDETILERTIVGAQALDYDHYRLWVCDDGRRPWLRVLCARLQCGYITRDDNAHAKAGNINNALRHLASLPERPEFIAILDADFVVRPTFLKRVVALMRDGRVGVVQTPQVFFNPDPIQSNLAIAHLWPDEQRYFFDVLMPSKDAWGMAFCCGTSSLIRSAPLYAMGGFPTDSVTEDYLLTLRFKEAGFGTVYLNEELSVGLAPEGLREYVVQRSRWCLGFMQIVRGASGPLSLKNSLSLLDRVMLIETFLHWSMAFTFRLLCILVPIMYLLFDIQAVYAHPTDVISYVLPFLAAHTALVSWLTRGRVVPILYDVNQLLVATEIVRSVVVGLTRPTGHKFRVTAKGGDRRLKLIQWPLLRIFLGLVTLTVAGIVWTYIVNSSRPLADATAIALFWSWYNLIILILACVIAVEEPQRRSSVRFQSDDSFEIVASGQRARFRLSDISVGGVGLLGQSPCPLGDAVIVSIDRVPVQGAVVRVSPNTFGVRFLHNNETRAHLIRHLFSGRYRQAVDKVQIGEVAFGILSRLWR